MVTFAREDEAAVVWWTTSEKCAQTWRQGAHLYSRETDEELYKNGIKLISLKQSHIILLRNFLILSRFPFLHSIELKHNWFRFAKLYVPQFSHFPIRISCD